MTISAGESLDKGWHQQDEAFLFQLKSETVSERTVPRGQRLYAFAQDGSLAAIWTEGERVHLQDFVYARLLLVHIEPCPLVFALREVLPCSYPGKSDRFRNGLHLQVQVHAGPAETLRELEEHAGNPQKLTRRGIGEILRAAAEEGRKSVDIQGIAEMEKVSDIAGAARLMEQPVIDFARENALPETVRFVCDSEKVATLYKVVYNMYYADSKETRLEDERWD